ncbi:phytanoyl-CoA dioxygenase family protein [Gammaproteobacteria bacterium]|nr:phytanoyl-CoA dioxygenase family protein [Gammaproteobacteria bacterium]
MRFSLAQIFRFFRNPKYKGLRTRALFRDLHLKERSERANEDIKKLIEDGFLIISWKKLFDEDHEFSALFTKMHHEAELTKAKTDSKYYVSKFSAGETIKDDGLHHFVTSLEVNNLVQSFFQAEYRFFSATYWRILSTVGRPKCGSQKWHTDPTDSVQLKIFVYLEDVNEDNGPCQFVKGSQVGGRLKWRPTFLNKVTGNYYSDNFVENLISKTGAEKISLTGKRGSILILNTTALHCGKQSETTRLMANSCFISDFRSIGPRTPLG